MAEMNCPILRPSSAHDNQLELCNGRLFDHGDQFYSCTKCGVTMSRKDIVDRNPVSQTVPKEFPDA